MRRSILIVSLFIAGCAATNTLQVGGLYKSESYNFSVELPQGWMRKDSDYYLYITRDGFLLQSIIIERSDIDEPPPEVTHLVHTFTQGRTISKGMLPQEAAEVVLGNTYSDPEVLSFNVIENTPTTISGFPGFKLVTTYSQCTLPWIYILAQFKNCHGLKFKSIYYGFMYGDWFYSIRYTAPLRYYFDKDVQTFEKVVESFKLNTAPVASSSLLIDGDISVSNYDHKPPYTSGGSLTLSPRPKDEFYWGPF